MKPEENASQFQCPRGFRGWLAGQVMAWWNSGINRLTLEMMDLTPRDHVLEIGFGPGTLIAKIAARAVDGYVAGIDRSATMVAAARRRNRKAIDRGRVELQPGEIARIPYPDARFDKVCSVNTIYFWSDPEEAAREIARVLRENGQLALAFRGAESSQESVPAKTGLGAYDIDAAKGLLTRAGFHDLTTEIRRLRTMTAVCIVGRK
jgi:SAM-dependent methyltransferase